MNVIQQPERARACGSGAKSSADRRPVDPPPVVELRIFEGAGEDKSDVTFGYKANFFLFATLELARPIANGRVQPPQQQVPVLTGMPVSGMAYLDRPLEAGYFIFPDLSVRHEGKYKLSFNLYEETKEDDDKDSPSQAQNENKSQVADGSPDKLFDWRLEVKSEPFLVYSAKKFPGLAESTLLSRTVAEQGCRVRIRRDVRMRRREDKPRDYEQEEDYRSQPQSIQGEYRQRSRSLSSEGSEGGQQRRASGEFNPAPTGGHLGWIPGGQQQGGFAAPQPPQTSFQTPQYGQQYRQPQPQPQAPLPSTSYSYDRPPYHQEPQQYPQSAYPTNPPREHELQPDYRRASVPVSYNPQPAPYPPASSDSNRNPNSFPSYLRPETPAGAVRLPPLNLAEPKFENQSSPLSSITRVTSGVVSPTFEPGQDRSYHYPTPLPSIDEASRNGKRSFAATFSSPTAAHKHEPLYNGMRPSIAHVEEDDSKEELRMPMIYKRANGDPYTRSAPNVFTE